MQKNILFLQRYVTCKSMTKWHWLYQMHHHTSLTWQVDEAIQPGLTSLNWTSLNIDTFLSHIDKTLGKQKSSKINVLYADALGFLQLSTSSIWWNLHSCINYVLALCLFSHTQTTLFYTDLLLDFSFCKFDPSSTCLSPSPPQMIAILFPPLL